jgi:hypothetical protein
LLQVHHAQALQQSLEHFICHTLGQQIRNLVLASAIAQSKLSITNQFSQVMKPHLNMLAPSVCNRILRKIYCRNIIHKRVVASSSPHPNSFIRFTNHIAWQALNDAAMYSASQEESATTGSFFEHHEIGVLPNIKM